MSKIVEFIPVTKESLIGFAIRSDGTVAFSCNKYDLETVAQILDYEVELLKK